MAAVAARTNKNQVRIRGPKPDVSLRCSALEEVGRCLSDQVQRNEESATVKPVYSQFILEKNVTFVLHDLSSEWKQALSVPADSWDRPAHVAVHQAVESISDSRQKLKRQRVISRQILKTISRADGFKYFEKEAWDTKHTDGYRFKFLCRDAYAAKEREKSLSKQRSSLSGALTPNDPDSLGGTPEVESLNRRNTIDLGVPPASECKGSIFIKFSASSQVIDIIYHHTPGHRTSRKHSREVEDVIDLSMPDVVEPAQHINTSTNTSLPPNSQPDIRAQPTPSPPTPPPPQLHRHQPVAPQDLSAPPPPPSSSAVKAMVRKASLADVSAQNQQTLPTQPSKKRKRSSKAVYKDVDDSLIGDEDSLTPGNQTPTTELTRPQRQYWRRDWSLSPTRDIEYFPDDKDFLKPSIVTRVMVLSTEGQAKASGRNSSDDASGEGNKKGSKKTTATKSKVVKEKEQPKPVRKPTAAENAAPSKTTKPPPAAATKANATLPISALSSNDTTKNAPLDQSTEDSTPTTSAIISNGISASDKPTRKRTKTGCWTCRSRKLKCDEMRPKCTQCARSRPPRECLYPGVDDEDGGGDYHVDTTGEPIDHQHAMNGTANGKLLTTMDQDMVDVNGTLATD